MAALHPNAPGLSIPGSAEPDPADTRLLEALRAQRSEGLDQLMEAHADAVYEFILFRVSQRRDVAEDLTQETLLAAVQGVGRFDGRSAIRTWLLGIAKNKIRESRRNADRMRPLGDILLDADDEIFATLGRIAEEPIPDELLEREETKGMVGATLSSLPESYRTALTERYIEGRSVPETARRQGRGVKAAESTLHRAKRAFAEVFALLNRRAATNEEMP